MNSSNALTSRYVHGDMVDELYARISAGGTAYWYLTDCQGSVRQVRNSAGALQDEFTYDSYGHVTYESNPSFNERFQHTGREADSETGLRYHRGRYYETPTGRWTSEDPKGFGAGDANLYRYVKNGPTNATDPSGQELVAWSMHSAEALRAYLAGEDGELTAVDGRVPKPVYVGYEQAASGRYVFTFDPEDIDYIQAVRDEARRSGDQGSGVERWRADALDALLSTKIHREVYWEKVTSSFQDRLLEMARSSSHPQRDLVLQALERGEGRYPGSKAGVSWNFRLVPTQLSWSEKAVANRNWSRPLYTLGGQLSERVGVLADKLMQLVERFTSEPLGSLKDYLLGIVEGFFVDGAWGDVSFICDAAKWYSKYVPATAVPQWIGMAIQGRPPWELYEKDFEFAQDVGKQVGKLISNAPDHIQRMFKLVETGMEVLDALVARDRKRLYGALARLGEKELEVVQFVALGLVEVAIKGADWLSPKNAGRIVGAILYEVTQNAVVDAVSLGTAAGLMAAKSGTKAAKLLDNFGLLGKADELIEGLAKLFKLGGQAENASDGRKALTKAERLSLHTEYTGIVSRAQRGCFACGTPVLTPEGHKPIETIREGDFILSADESLPDGPIEAKRVERTHQRLSGVIQVWAGGRGVKLTDEHPLYVVGEGWTAAGELRAGQRLRSHDGQVVAVERVEEEQEVTAVYNLTIQDYHTFFVGRRDWGFSVWVHNVDILCQIQELENQLKKATTEAERKDLTEAIENLRKQLPAKAAPPTKPRLQRPSTADEIAEDLGMGAINKHGDPGKWKYQWTKREPATERGASPGDYKVYERWIDEFGKEIEWHYTVRADGSVSVGKLSRPSTTKPK